MVNEKRLIDANALITNLRTFKGLGKMVAETLVRFVEKQPTVDAVEVVRCRECKHWDEIEDTCGGGYCNHSCWVVLDAEPPIVNHTDFCSYGERRTDNGI